MARSRGRGAVGQVQRSVQLTLLGGFELTCEGQPVPLTITLQRLLAFLALADRPTGRSYVAGVLWLDTSDARANASLRSALWRLGKFHLPLIDVTSTQLTLGPRVGVDLRESRALTQRLVDPADKGDDLSMDARLLSADLLPDWYDEWVLVERERYRQLRLHGLEFLCQRLTTAGRLAEAVEAGVAAVGAEPLRESAHRILIAAHLAEGNFGEAVRQYRQFRLLLQDELGVEPSGDLTALVSTFSKGALASVTSG